jgi:hypothetical protein
LLGGVTTSVAMPPFPIAFAILPPRSDQQAEQLKNEQS